MAELLTTSTADLRTAADRLRAGRLVSFPTETVYGLGANALDGEASKRIFEVKGRPPTDPLICHVTKYEKALPLWDACVEELQLIEALSVLWPGPLTIVAKASSVVPTAVTGGSGFVGVRVPQHDVAMALLEAADVPVCAPSANLFGHVSPTSAAHVMGDLALRDSTLSVIDGGNCAVGIESSVVKIVSSKKVEILRRGFVLPDALTDALQKAGLNDVVVEVRDTRAKSAKVEAEPQDGPGQLLTHYSPNIPAFLVGPKEIEAAVTTKDSSSVATTTGVSFGLTTNDSGAAVTPMNKVAVIDFHGTLSFLKNSCIAYKTLSDGGDAEEAAAATFDSLRWCEGIDGAEAVIFPYLTEFVPSASTSSSANGGSSRRSNGHSSSSNTTAPTWELVAAVEDRLYRAASGCRATIVTLQ